MSKLLTEIETLAAEVVASGYTDQQSITRLKELYMDAAVAGLPRPTTKYAALALSAFTAKPGA